MKFWLTTSFICIYFSLVSIEGSALGEDNLSNNNLLKTVLSPRKRRDCSNPQTKYVYHTMSPRKVSLKPSISSTPSTVHYKPAQSPTSPVYYKPAQSPPSPVYYTPSKSKVEKPKQRVIVMKSEEKPKKPCNLQQNFEYSSISAVPSYNPAPPIQAQHITTYPVYPQPHTQQVDYVPQAAVPSYVTQTVPLYTTQQVPSYVTQTAPLYTTQQAVPVYTSVNTPKIESYTGQTAVPPVAVTSPNVEILPNPGAVQYVMVPGNSQSYLTSRQTSLIPSGYTQKLQQYVPLTRAQSPANIKTK